MPIDRTRMIRYEFVRPYKLSPGCTSYLDEIHMWAQHVQVHLVDWEIRPVSNNTRDGFYAFPIFPDCQGHPYSEYARWGSTRDGAREDATQLLIQAHIDANSPLVRWRFSESHTAQGTVHYVTPILYRQNTVMWDDRNVIGRGSSHRRAKEDSARKLLELGYCRV